LLESVDSSYVLIYSKTELFVKQAPHFLMENL
jgi:hypothetical protein